MPSIIESTLTTRLPQSYHYDHKYRVLKCSLCIAKITEILNTLTLLPIPVELADEAGHALPGIGDDHGKFPNTHLMS